MDCDLCGMPYMAGLDYKYTELGFLCANCRKGTEKLSGKKEKEE